ncbi:hypothetical protein GC106_68230 [Kibdelosporangium sp. 4NS15]|uniref:Ig-like domain-containing protein n=1 Tax=Kibdelosporangium persicum TaxID=2698649 RepID=A0ABX2FDX1_9PSEU|nr:hypothetical protein [Kibdelosporangium persicum]NRN69566.1 hypothetical protein [Kibdelosporangium persicum]
MRRALSLIFGMAMAVLAVPVSPAAAATSVSFTPRTILAPGVPEQGFDQNVVPVGTVSLNMTAGQTAYIVSVMRFNSATGRSLADNEVVCKWAGGSKNMVIGQNVLQRGTGYPDLEDIQLTTRYLVQPDVTGTVTCTAQVRSASLGYDDEYFTLASGSLSFADQSVDNTTAGTPIQSSVPRTVYFDPANPTLRVPATGMFDLAPGFRGLSVFGDTNYEVLKPCSDPGCTTGASTARFTLFVNQWKADGTVCQSASTPAVTKTMLYSVHHVYVPLNKLFEIRTDAGCIPRFNAYVKVDHVSGYSGGVHGIARNLPDARGASTTHNSDMSHIFAVPYK